MIFETAEPWNILFASLFDSYPHDAASRKSWKFFLGLFLIFLQCLILVFNAVLTQVLFEDYELGSPFMMTYVGVSMMAPLLPIYMWMERNKQRKARIQRDESQCEPYTEAAFQAATTACCRTPSFDSLADDLSQTKGYDDIVKIAKKRTQRLMDDHTNHWNHRKHIMAALLISPAMFLADWAFNAALLRTSIASATVLVSVQSIFVYVMEVFLSFELFSACKFVGIMAGVAGTALTAFHDTTDEDGELQDAETGIAVIWGDTLAIMAAVAYATYAIQVRLYCPANEDLYSTTLLLGYIGVISMVLLSPVAFWLLVVERLNMSFMTWMLLVVKGLFDFCITDYLLFRSIILTGPTISTVGLGLSIPMAFLADISMGKDDVLSWYSSVGALACLVGFLVVNLAPTPGHTNDETDAVAEATEGDKSDRVGSMLTNDYVVL